MLEQNQTETKSKKALTPEERQELIAEILEKLCALGLVTDSDEAKDGEQV